MNKTKEYLEVSEVARYFSLSESTVYRLIREKMLKATRFGVSGGVRVKRAHVEEFERRRLEQIEEF